MANLAPTSPQDQVAPIPTKKLTYLPLIFHGVKCFKDGYFIVSMHTCGRGEDWHYLIDPKVVSNEIGVRYPTECSTQLKLKHVPCIFV